jgi:hypothetical protein
VVVTPAVAFKFVTLVVCQKNISCFALDFQFIYWLVRRKTNQQMVSPRWKNNSSVLVAEFKVTSILLLKDYF